MWWSQPGSNRRPPQCHCGALPAELWPQETSRIARDVRRAMICAPFAVSIFRLFSSPLSNDTPSAGFLDGTRSSISMRHASPVRSLRPASKLQRQVPKTDPFRLSGDWEAVFTCVNDESASRLEILAGGVKAAADPGRKRAFDLDCPHRAAPEFDDEVDLGPTARPVEGRQGWPAQCRQESLDGKALPTLANHRMSGERLQRRNAQQRMDQATITNVDLRRLHQALSNVRPQRRETPHKQQIYQQVDVSRDRLRAHLQRVRQCRGVEERSLSVSKHRPESFESGRRHTRTELGNITLQVSSDEVLAPSQARIVIGSEVAHRESATQPETFSGSAPVLHFDGR